ncbi:MAG: HAMP domain-containing protein [Chloroflexi bacterium]|nr:HAMP domain-containing protein [Chloroflexota bacterium]
MKLGAKLFLAFLLVIFIGLTALAVAIQFTAPGALNRHMYGMGQGMGMGMGQGQGMGQTLLQDVRNGVNEALGWAALAAIFVAGGVSLLLSHRIVAPLQELTRASQRIATGKFDERVNAAGQDELGQLGHSFNQMAVQLEQVEAMRRQLIGDVSHELRTPLTAIKGSMEALIDGLLPADAETYEQVRAEADRLNRLVDDLQELSRVEAPAFHLDIAPVDIPALIATTIKRATPAAQTKRIILTSRGPRQLPPLPADEDRLGQVLLNLVANAIQYTDEGGAVTIETEQKNHQIEISVKDTGIGIPPEQLTHIFTRFYRVDKSRSRATGGGSGIGLTIARRLVEAHGGKIWAESEGIGKGSRFVIALPLL